MWYVYIVECKDKSLYTGITNNIKKRLRQHNGEITGGAKSLQGKKPVYLLYKEEYASKQEALKREYSIKQWKRENKIKLINNEGFTLKNFV